MLLECLFIVASAAGLGAVIGLLMRPFKSFRIAAGAARCGHGGVFLAVAWWLASFTPDNLLFRYILDGITGFVGLSAILFIFMQLIGLKNDPVI